MTSSHFSVSSVRRSRQQSAVAKAAYQSRECLFSEADNEKKDYHKKAGDILAKGIILPYNAPAEYRDRQTLWNAVEKNEKRCDSRLAQTIVMALPEELPKTEYEELIRSYCKEQFVSKGMIADYAIHDNEDSNPHAHIMLTLRTIDENGAWRSKCHRVYDLDENGERIKLPSGKYKHHDEYTAEWSSREIVGIWRTAWADAVNRCFEKNGIDRGIDLTSYEAQGIEELPTVHLGPAATALETKDIRTELGDYNRQITAFNEESAELNDRLSPLEAEIAEIDRKLDAITAEEEADKDSVLSFINEYYDMRKNHEHVIWGDLKLQKAIEADLEQYDQLVRLVQENRLVTTEDLYAFAAHYEILEDRISENEKRIRKLNDCVGCIKTVVSLQDVAEKAKNGFWLIRERYEKSHSKELDRYYSALRFLKENGIKPGSSKALLDEIKSLKEQNRQIRSELDTMDISWEQILQICECIDKVIDVREKALKEATVTETPTENRNENIKTPKKRNRDDLEL